jgi:hypothetical protein
VAEFWHPTWSGNCRTSRVRIESDGRLLTDVPADLPQLGQRVSYFSVTATRPEAGEAAPANVISVKLPRTGAGSRQPNRT